MCMTPSSEDIRLYDEARKAYREKDLAKLKEIYKRLIELDNANPEIVYIVKRMIDELETAQKAQA